MNETRYTRTMRIGAAYHPDIHEFIPKTRRGHGTTHPTPKYKDGGAQVRNACVCVNPACSLLRRPSGDDERRRGEAHRDPAANAQDWKLEHGFHKDTPLEYCR